MSGTSVIDLLRDVITRRVELEFKFVGVSICLRPHVLYDSRNGALTLGGVVTNTGIFTNVPVNQIQDVVVTGRAFQPDPSFNRRYANYHNPHAIIKSP